MLNHILITLDGSSLAEKALQHVDILKPGGRITLLSVVDSPLLQTGLTFDVPVALINYDEDEFVANAVTSARQYLDRMAQNLISKGYGVDVVVEVGDPASTIVDAAVSNKVDAIIMSTHGRTGLGRWIFGSVTQKVMTQLPCPVFIVPGKEKVESASLVKAPEHRIATT